MRLLVRRLGILVVVPAALAATACRVPAPLHECHVEPGSVRAESAEVCERFASIVDELVPRIRSTLPALRDDSVEVWVQARLKIYRWQRVPDFVTGFVHADEGRRIHLRSDAQYPENALCHELVHALLGERWEALPALLEEGLCDHVALELVEDGRDASHTRRLLDGARYLGELKPTLQLSYEPSEAVRTYRTVEFTFQRPRDTNAAPPEVALRFAGKDGESVRGLLNAHHYGFGVWLVERVVERQGYDGLLRLCDRARAKGQDIVQLEDILAASELGAKETWQRELLAELEPRDLRLIVLENLSGLVTAVAEGLDEFGPEGTDDRAKLADCRFELHLQRCPHTIDLLRVPEFVDALDEELAER